MIKSSPLPLRYYARRQDSTLNAHEPHEWSVTDSITIDPYDIAYLKRFITNKDILNQLLPFLVANTLTTQDIYRYYTNSSLKQLDSDVLMGVSWTNDTGTQQFSCRIEHWPSSTRAELAAIWVTLLIIPSNKHVVIYTDSQAAIDGIKEATNPRSSRFSCFNNTNHTLKLLIKDCTDSKHLRVTYIKVKGHSNDILNDQADELAKKGRQGLLLSLDFNNLDSLFFNVYNISFRPKWKDIPIENRLRPALKIINQSIIESRWTTSKGVRDSLFLAGRQINCHYTWAAFKPFSHHRCVTFYHHRHWIYLIKLVNDMLPTADILAERFGTIFESWTCPLCNKERTASRICSHVLTSK